MPKKFVVEVGQIQPSIVKSPVPNVNAALLGPVRQSPLVTKLLLQYPLGQYGVTEPCVGVPLRVIVKLLALESRNVLFCCPLMLVVSNSNGT